MPRRRDLERPDGPPQEWGPPAGTPGDHNDPPRPSSEPFVSSYNHDYGTPDLISLPRRRERWWLHALLFLLTLATTTWMGMGFALNYRPSLLPPGADVLDLRGLLLGALSFSIPVLSILFAHEMGHYLACRYYGIDASPPYFIPFPSLAGTMGAFIRIREPFRDKRELFDVGIGGPIAGFVVALPVAAYGILHTKVNLLQPAAGTLVFHYPLAITALQKLLIGHTFSSLDVVEHPALVAGWFGLFVTAMNLLPIGQLDGGHVLYAVAGKRHRLFKWPFLAALAVMGLYFKGWWVLAVLLLIVGLKHPPLMDEDAPLDRGRLLVAAFAVFMFIVSFVPMPLELIEEPSGPRRPPPESSGTVVHELDLHRCPEHPRLDV
ncbi:MAG: site-2 protease family protein [Acidobacteria bacterium]|nr:site-2 protease family protein [Acidobacteriota bacterium]